MHTVLAETLTPQLLKLRRVYKEDPFKARVLFFNSPHGHTQDRLILYEEGNDFSIVHYSRTWGISRTTRSYNRERVIGSVTFKRGKFYITSQPSKVKTVRQLIYFNLQAFLINCPNSKVVKPLVEEYINKRFSWTRFIFENPILYGRAWNTFLTHKLFNLNDSLRYFLKVPLPVCQEIMKHYNSVGGYSIKDWHTLFEVMDRVDNLKSEQLGDITFNDLCRMAKVLGRRVNCAWSPKRVKLEHDTWSREISTILFDCEEERDLVIKPCFLEFAQLSGWRILKTNRELMMEGMLQKHCVATYVDNVNYGSCAIYHIQGHTLELRRYNTPNDGLYLGQLKGQFNAMAPPELQLEVQNMLNKYNASLELKPIKEPSKYHSPFKALDEVDDEIIF